MKGIIKTGNSAEISLAGRGNEKKGYKTKVEEVVDDTTIKIYTPTSLGTYVTFFSNSVYEVFFITSLSLYVAKMKFDKHIINGNQHLTVLKLASELTKSQRREYFRLEANISFRFAVVNKKAVPNGDLKNYLENIYDYITDIPETGNTKDISAGGIRFLSNVRLTEGDIILVNITLNSINFFVVGQIAFSAPSINKLSLREYSAKFISISKSDKELIMKYVWNQQRKL